MKINFESIQIAEFRPRHGCSTVASMPLPNTHTHTAVRLSFSIRIYPITTLMEWQIREKIHKNIRCRVSSARNPMCMQIWFVIWNQKVSRHFLAYILFASALFCVRCCRLSADAYASYCRELWRIEKHSLLASRFELKETIHRESNGCRRACAILRAREATECVSFRHYWRFSLVILCSNKWITGLLSRQAHKHIRVFSITTTKTRIETMRNEYSVAASSTQRTHIEQPRTHAHQVLPFSLDCCRFCWSLS